MYKICGGCKETKDDKQFHRLKRSKDGFQAKCKVCQRKYHKNRDKSQVYSLECEKCHIIFSRVRKTELIEKTRTKRCNRCLMFDKLKANGGRPTNYCGTEHFASRTIQGWKFSAAKRHHEWALSYEDIENQYLSQKGYCALSGIKMEGNSKSPLRPSLDRINSKMGYLVGNIQFVCCMINVMKNKYDEKQFIKMCGLIFNHSKTKALDGA